MVNKKIVVIGSGLIGNIVTNELKRELGKMYEIVACGHDVFKSGINVIMSTPVAMVVLCGASTVSRKLVDVLPESVPILDMSPAFRTSWTYGLGDWTGDATRVANPGCFATGVIYLLAPLVKHGIIRPSDTIYIDGVGGRSVGGNNMDEQYHRGAMDDENIYSLSKPHHHIPEILKATGHKGKLWFKPKLVAPIYSGMRVQFMVPGTNTAKLYDIYQEEYKNDTNVDCTGADKNISLGSHQGIDGITINVFQDGDDCLVTANLDNLKIGSASTAVNNIKKMLNIN